MDIVTLKEINLILTVSNSIVFLKKLQNLFLTIQKLEGQLQTKRSELK